MYIEFPKTDSSKRNIKKLQKMEGFSIEIKEFTHAIKDERESSPYAMVTIEMYSLEVHNTQDKKMIGFIDKSDYLAISFSNEHTKLVNSFKERDTCDCCETNRVRNVYYIVQDSEGKAIQVGKSCLKKHLGIHPQLILIISRIMREFKNWFGGEIGLEDLEMYPSLPVHQTMEVLDYLTYAQAYIEKFGYVSNQKAREDFHLTTTTQDLRSILTSRIKDSVFGNPEENGIDMKASEEKAKLVFDYIDGLEKDENDSYMNTVKQLFENGYVHEKYFGYLTFLPEKYRRDHYEKKEKANKPSGHFLEVKSKFESKVKLLGRSSLLGYYGPTYIYNFLEIESNALLTWVTSNALNVEDDSLIYLKGTVKDHKECDYRKTQQTLITRCKVLHVLEEDATIEELKGIVKENKRKEKALKAKKAEQLAIFAEQDTVEFRIEKKNELNVLFEGTTTEVKVYREEIGHEVIIKSDSKEEDKEKFLKSFPEYFYCGLSIGQDLRFLLKTSVVHQCEEAGEALPF